MMPQHKDEICLSAMAVKTEKKSLNGTWLNPKYYIMGNQHPSFEQRKVQRLSASQVFGEDCGGRLLRR